MPTNTDPPKVKLRRGFNVRPWPPQKPEGAVEKPRRMFRGLPSAAPPWVALVDGKAIRRKLFASLPPADDWRLQRRVVMDEDGRAWSVRSLADEVDDHFKRAW